MDEEKVTAPCITKELVLSAMQVIADFCKNYRCKECPIKTECHSYFTDKISPATWEVPI